MQSDDEFSKSVITQSVALARQVLKGKPNRLEALLELVRGRNAAIDSASAHPGHHTECGPGCFACCHQLVAIEQGEALLLALYLHQSRSPEELAGIKARAALVACVPATQGARFKTATACPLLADGRCGVHKARPAACRMTFSASRLACVTALAASNEDRHAPVPWFAPAGAYAALIQMGIDHVLAQAWGVSTEKVELAKALHIALADPQQVTADWLAGKDPLKDAEVPIAPTPNRLVVQKAIKRLRIR